MAALGIYLAVLHRLAAVHVPMSLLHLDLGWFDLSPEEASQLALVLSRFTRLQCLDPPVTPVQPLADGC